MVVGPHPVLQTGTPRPQARSQLPLPLQGLPNGPGGAGGSRPAQLGAHTTGAGHLHRRQAPGLPAHHPRQRHLSTAGEPWGGGAPDAGLARPWPPPHVLKTAVRSCEHPSRIMSRLCPLCLPHCPLGAPWGQTEPSAWPPCPLRPGLCTGCVPSRAPFPQTPHGFVPQPFPVFPQTSPPLGPPLRSPCHPPSPGPPISPSRPSVPTSLCPPQLKPFASSPTFTASSSRLGAQGFLSPYGRL